MSEGEAGGAGEAGEEHEESPRTINTFSNLAQLTNNLNATLTSATGVYPADLGVDDIFADIDDDDDVPLPSANNSLKLKVDGVFLQDP